ncbi:hypothetical protein ACIRD2_03215 [Streptomyces sp. NPDC093595]|uniref:hypothetical protein n=1 Tax=Streptomyces sp. NPDC093595 TaxID=3366045 RepID=UPI0037FD11E3
METPEPVFGDYLDEARLPLLTVSEAREVVRLLQQLDDDEALDLAGRIGRRLPADG